MKLLIDTNILLDVMMEREEHYEKSAAIWRGCEAGLFTGFVSVLTAANIMYIMRRQMDPETISDVIQKLELIFRFTELTPADLRKAAEMQWRDFEDAIQSVTARRVRADYIITRNTRDYSDSPIQAITPDAFFLQLQ